MFTSLLNSKATAFLSIIFLPNILYQDSAFAEDRSKGQADKYVLLSCESFKRDLDYNFSSVNSKTIQYKVSRPAPKFDDFYQYSADNDVGGVFICDKNGLYTLEGRVYVSDDNSSAKAKEHRKDFRDLMNSAIAALNGKAISPVIFDDLMRRAAEDNNKNRACGEQTDYGNGSAKTLAMDLHGNLLGPYKIEYTNSDKIVAKPVGPVEGLSYQDQSIVEAAPSMQCNSLDFQTSFGSVKNVTRWINVDLLEYRTSDGVEVNVTCSNSGKFLYASMYAEKSIPNITIEKSALDMLRAFDKARSTDFSSNFLGRMQSLKNEYTASRNENCGKIEKYAEVNSDTEQGYSYYLSMTEGNLQLAIGP